MGNGHVTSAQTGRTSDVSPVIWPAGLGAMSATAIAPATAAASTSANPADFFITRPALAAACGSARALRHERARLRDLSSHWVGILRERDGRGVMRSRLGGIA